MVGGDPYIRALMRTISASEANDLNPYSLLYGGQHLEDLSQHPDRCITIVAGPNTGDCTTASGRYQFLTTTWLDKAHQYHPQPPSWHNFWQPYSFAPEFQDQVVYAWLNDPYAWGFNISQLLQQGEIHTVLRLLSGTWTSLGYGIEDNAVTGALPQIYQEMLAEELQAVRNEPQNRL
ncbi:MAG: glycoside hydrolase family protein [Cyanothece sp. SIO1E1]|nr:glycoside hydrolase family protein [Cyanothece sp. SIO1E1]